MPLCRIAPIRLAAGALAILACSLLVAHPTLARRHARAPATGLPAIAFAKPPPDFSFDAGAGPQALDSLYGRPVVLNFWASWCEPCQAEVGALATLRRTYGDAVSLVTISEDRAPGIAREYLRAHAVDGIAIDDPERRIFDLYSVVPIPVTLVLAPSGAVSHVSVGEIDWPELQAAVEAVRPVAPQPSDLTLPHAFATLRGNAGTPRS